MFGLGYVFCLFVAIWVCWFVVVRGGCDVGLGLIGCIGYLVWLCDVLFGMYWVVSDMNSKGCFQYAEGLPILSNKALLPSMLFFYS